MLCSRRGLWKVPSGYALLQPLKRAEAVPVFSGDKDQTTGFTVATPFTPKPRAEIAPNCSWGHAAGFNDIQNLRRVAEARSNPSSAIRRSPHPSTQVREAEPRPGTKA
jgi:hypothetical protein